MEFGIYTLIIEGIYTFERGYGNGYVLLPPEHPFYGVGYYNIDVSVYGD